MLATQLLVFPSEINLLDLTTGGQLLSYDIGNLFNDFVKNNPIYPQTLYLQLRSDPFSHFA